MTSRNTTLRRSALAMASAGAAAALTLAAAPSASAEPIGVGWDANVTTTVKKLNQQITWYPEHVKDGQFGKWLSGARDWSISRSAISRARSRAFFSAEGRSGRR